MERGKGSGWSAAVLLGFAILLLGASSMPLCAQAVPLGTPEDPTRVLYAFTLRHQPASEAVGLVRPLLSPVGTVELQPGGNTLVIRDGAATLSRILPALAAFDHPAEAVRVGIQIVRAGAVPVSPQVKTSGLDAALLERLRTLLRYDAYHLMAKAQLDVEEGQPVRYQFGDYVVSFRLGTLLDRHLKLTEFRISRLSAPASRRALLQTNVNLWLDQTMILGLSSDEASHSALLVALRCGRKTTDK